MTELLTIAAEPPDHPGMDFTRLRREGMALIEQLGTRIWTDYNSSDPGVTILEQLCYAITDLSYRLDFDMQDLLAEPPEAAKQHARQFFTAREILTVNPLTINDYRKLIIDQPGVKNAWLEAIAQPLPDIYYDAKAQGLTFDAGEQTERVRLNGLYRVLIEKETGVDDEAALIQSVTSLLHRHRNLGEDFAEIKILPLEEITVRAELDIADGYEANELMAKIYAGLDRFISPAIEFFTLQQLLAKGKTSEEIFNGPKLRHGFIDDEQLRRFGRKTELHTSDLIHIILNIPGVEAVKSIAIASSLAAEPELWALPLDPGHTPRLQGIDSIIDSAAISFSRAQIPADLDAATVKAGIKALQPETWRDRTTPNPAELDIPLPEGEYRELADYVSLQEEFPVTYGLGTTGLPASATARRKAQARQLQAYLTFFDQVLANYFAQLDNVRDLFSFHNGHNRTYFTQVVAGLPRLAEVLVRDLEGYTAALGELAEQPETARARRNRFLDHLLARYGEQFPDPSLLRYEARSPADQPPAAKMIEDKLALLQAYPRIGAERGRAFDYREAAGLEATGDNISGLKRRICSLLGIPYTHGRLASKSNTEGFHLVEHILLRPRPVSAGTQAGSFLALAYPDQDPDPYSFQISIVLPTWPERCKDEKFRQLVDDVLIAETPAHISIYRHWLGKTRMQRFETAYYNWLEKIAHGADTLAASYRLVEQLGIGQGPLSPSETEGLIVHLSGDTPVEATKWPDISGQGNNGFVAGNWDHLKTHHVTGYNGRDFGVVRYGSNGGLDIQENLNVQKPFTIMIVDRYYGSTKGRTLQSSSTNWLLGKWGGQNACFMGGWLGEGVDAKDDEFAINTATLGDDGPAWYLNSKLQVSSGGTASPGRLSFGKGGKFDEPSEADIAALLIWNRVLSDEERQQVEQWLSNKYGIELAESQS